MAEPLILQNFQISAAEKPIVSISLIAASGEVTTLMGPSGSGKSSILAAITGTLPAGLTAAGEIRVGDQNLSAIPPWKRRIGILFQDDLLFPHLSVGGNLAIGLAPGGTRAERRSRVETALANVGLEGFAARDPEHSGRSMSCRPGTSRRARYPPRRR